MDNISHLPWEPNSYSWHNIFKLTTCISPNNIGRLYTKPILSAIVVLHDVPLTASTLALEYSITSLVLTPHCRTRLLAESESHGAPGCFEAYKTGHHSNDIPSNDFLYPATGDAEHTEGVGEGIAVHGHGTVDLDLLADGDTAVSGAAPGGGVRAAGDALYGGGHLDVEALGSCTEQSS